MNLADRMASLLSAVLLFFAAHSLCTQHAVAGSSAGESVAPLRPDFEFDPTPYFEHGYSFHAGIGWSHWRVEGEVLKTDVPEWVRQ
jgi:hypothetical protein